MRQALRAARKAAPAGDARKKLTALRAASHQQALRLRQAITRIMSFDADFDRVPGIVRIK